MDFFERANQHVWELNSNERKIFEYVVGNIEHVKDMHIRSLAAACFVSTTTIMRFTKKLGFSGYRDFSESLRETCRTTQQFELSTVLKKRSYSEEYLKNIIESVRVITESKILQFKQAVENSTRIYFYGVGLDREIARYAYRIYTGLGFYASCLLDDFEVKAIVKQIEDNDLLFLFSLSGEEREVIEFVEQTRLRCNPIIASVTQSANNTLQSLSTIDLYVFTDKIKKEQVDLSSRISMVAIAELLAYNLITPEGNGIAQ